MKDSAVPGCSPAIAINQAAFAFNGNPLFAGLSLRFAGGQITGLLGPSGCGKSTLLKLIAGSLKIPEGGTLHLEPDPGPGRHIAWMGQNDLLLPWLTLLENVLLGPRLRGEQTETIRQRALELIALAGLAGYAQALPATLSGGMRQRAALLRTLMEDCPILLMDEPFSALDALTRTRLQDLAVRLTKGKTVLLVTHDPLEALRLCDQIVVFTGPPMSIASSISPEGSAPRDLDTPSLASQYGQLMHMLLNGVPA